MSKNVVFQYYCDKCGSPAKKDPLVAAPIEKRPAMGTLGSWRCTGGCRGKIKVRREKA